MSAWYELCHTNNVVVVVVLNIHAIWTRNGKLEHNVFVSNTTETY